jgi:hypothetical protein
MSQIEWPMKPSQYAVLGPVVPFNIRCLPDSCCNHVNERGVHRLSIVDYNGNVGQVRVQDDDYLHRRSAIPVPAYGILIALSLFAQDQLADFRQARHNMFQSSIPVPIHRSENRPDRIQMGIERPSEFSPGRSGTRESSPAPSRKSNTSTSSARVPNSGHAAPIPRDGVRVNDGSATYRARIRESSPAPSRQSYA